MYKKTHQRLTFVFTAITSLIMIVMSIFYIYMSEHTQRTNGMLSFSSDMNTLISNCEQQNEISYEWLSKIESNGNYIMAAYDNDKPLAFNTRNHDANQDALIDEVNNYCIEQDFFSNLSFRTSSYTSIHHEFNYISDSYGSYYVCYASIAGYSGNFHVLVLSRSPQHLKQQFQEQRLIFVVIDSLVVLVLFLFSWIYTKKLLEPIEENQKKQIQFVASASHELRTPLAVILSSISAIKKSDSEQQRHFFSVIESESNRMSDLIGDMLTLASADNHSWTISTTSVELDTLLLNCYESFTAISQQKQIAFHIELPDDAIPPCSCDEKRIHQVLTILLHNAFSYTTSGGFVKIALTLTSNYFVITVADNGKGIPDEDKPHIFERFYRSSSAGSNQEHFGLGLCIAKEIVDAHQGSIAVKDTVEKGRNAAGKCEFRDIGADLNEIRHGDRIDLNCGSTFVIKLRR